MHLTSILGPPGPPGCPGGPPGILWPWNCGGPRMWGGPLGFIMRGWWPGGGPPEWGGGPPMDDGGPLGPFEGGGLGRVFCWLSNWLRACLVAGVTMGICPCIVFFGRRSMVRRMLDSEPRVITQKPFDCPLARFSKNFTSWKSFTPMSSITSAISWSVVHCKEIESTKKPKWIMKLESVFRKFPSKNWRKCRIAKWKIYFLYISFFLFSFFYKGSFIIFSRVKKLVIAHIFHVFSLFSILNE